MERSCDVCGITYLARRATSRYCSGACRAAASRGAKRRPPAPVVPLAKPPKPTAEDESTPPGAVEEATLAELRAVDRVATAAGQRALALARLIDSPPKGSLGSAAGWHREHGSAMALATAGTEVPRASSVLDEIRARRDAKRHA